MNIVLLGIQGSGKGTLVLDLEKHLEFSLISMGQLLRDEVATGSVLGQEIAKLIDNGMLVTIDMIKQVIGKKLNNTKELTIFDGFPRNNEQADMLDEIANIDLVVYLNLSREKAVERIVSRLTCIKCGNITSEKSTNSRICEKCGGKLAKRNDDTPEAVGKRLELYLKETYPLLERYKKRGIVLEVDASKTKQEVFEIVYKVIKNEHKN